MRLGRFTVTVRSKIMFNCDNNPSHEKLSKEEGMAHVRTLLYRKRACITGFW
jgi:hypothetical protein